MKDLRFFNIDHKRISNFVKIGVFRGGGTNLLGVHKKSQRADARIWCPPPTLKLSYAQGRFQGGAAGPSPPLTDSGRGVAPP